MLLCPQNNFRYWGNCALFGIFWYRIAVGRDVCGGIICLRVCASCGKHAGDRKKGKSPNQGGYSMKLMRKNGGFTLVELIVVIAILAILAGIAVPAYSGYIKKAEKAADMQLLGAINEAFAAACVATGSTVYDVESASLTWNGKCVTGVATVNGAANADCNKNFQLLYAGNETTAFKAVVSMFISFRDSQPLNPPSSSIPSGKTTLRNE